MEYRKVEEIQSWPRRETFDHFYKQIPNVITITADVDVASMRDVCRGAGLRFFPSFLYLLCRVVNRHDEFKMGHNAEGEAVIWEQVSPSYTVFQEKDASFYSLNTAYHPDFSIFYQMVVSDMERGQSSHPSHLDQTAPNTFYVSCIPWLQYRSFGLQMYDDGKLLCPIFTWGKFEPSGKQMILPFTVQIHHACADGFHIAAFYHELQKELDGFSLEPTS